MNNVINWATKECGKQHAFCNECKPDNNVGIHMKGRTPWNKGLTDTDTRVMLGSKKRADAMRGRKLTPEHKRKIGEGISKIIAERGFPWPPTPLEFSLDLLMQDTGFSYEAQVKIGRYIVDAWVPEYQIAFEADGGNWHKDRKRDTIRDKYLVEEKGVEAVIRLNEKDLAPWRIR